MPSEIATLLAQAYLRLLSESAKEELAVPTQPEASCAPVNAREESAA